MKKHADLIRPKFEALISIMEEDLGGLDIAEWTNLRAATLLDLIQCQAAQRKS